MKDFIKALFTDGEWDGDATKFCGFLILVAALAGFFFRVPGFEFVMAFGAALIASGKFSSQG
jgi:hypothetical protein